MRTLATLALCLACAACAGAGATEGGVANYDALRKAQADCAAKGGELQLRRLGDPQVLSDFSCKRK